MLEECLAKERGRGGTADKGACADPSWPLACPPLVSIRSISFSNSSIRPRPRSMSEATEEGRGSVSLGSRCREVDEGFGRGAAAEAGPTRFA